MKNINWLKIALMTLVLGVVIPAMMGCKTSGLANTGSHTVKYTCPMHPEVVQGTPGNCPICGMRLVETTTAVSSTTP
jgi:hypothetical protein